MDLKTLQDWVLQRRFKAVPGRDRRHRLGRQDQDLRDGGRPRPAHRLRPDPAAAAAALNNANVNVGGNTVNIGGQSAVVRGVGLIRTIDDIQDTMLTQIGGSPVLVRDVATRHGRQQPRLGIAGKDDEDDIVQGIVLMRRGERSMPTIKRGQARSRAHQRGGILPPGVTIERIYDRKDLIDITTHTVLHNMVVGILLIFLLQWLFLGNLRCALIVAATIPFALFFAIGMMVVRGESANLLSVGAIDFGLIVDATVIMVEASSAAWSATAPQAAPAATRTRRPTGCTAAAARSTAPRRRSAARSSSPPPSSSRASCRCSR